MTVGESTEKSSDTSIASLAPGRVRRPSDRAELARIIAACDAKGESIVLYGGGTLQALGFSAKRCDVAIDLRGLDAVVAYEPSDLTIGVECGMTVAALERILAERGQYVPLDVPRAYVATVGGSLAAGWLGPRRASLGRMRDFIIGSTAALADGTIASAGGMVVKNVTGYDLSRLYVGSFGSLVAIASVNFKTLPMPACRVALRGALPAGARARAFQAIRQSDVEPSAALSSAGYASELDRTEGDDGSLFVLFEGSESLVERGVRALTATLAELDIHLEAAQETPEAALARVIDASIEPAGADTSIYKTFGNASALDVRYAALRTIGSANGFAMDAICDARTGDLTARFTPAAGNANDAATIALDASVHARSERALVVRAPAAVRDRLAMWGHVPAGMPVMRELKERFDPKGTFAPGRFLDRI